MDSAGRRSSSRSIKRKKFDDELVEYSLGPPGVSNIKNARAGIPFLSSAHSEYAAAVNPPRPTGSASTSAVEMKHKPVTKKVSIASRRRKTGKLQNQFVSKDFNRWKPTDDLALIIGTLQTSDLRLVHLGTKFSHKFTALELQKRWYALLYDAAVSRAAVAAIRNLHPSVIAKVQDQALWSTQEEELLGTIKPQYNPTLNTFAELLSRHVDVFFSSRTAIALQRHWHTMHHYHLLPDQVASSLRTENKPILDFGDAEDLLRDVQLDEPSGEILDHEILSQYLQDTHEIRQLDVPSGEISDHEILSQYLQDTHEIRQLDVPSGEISDHEILSQNLQNTDDIRQLENAVGRVNVLVDSVTGDCLRGLDNQTLAVLQGRLVRYLLRGREISIGRTGKCCSVDIDLSLEGPAKKISRHQGTLKLHNTGEFYLSSEGKRPIFVDGRPIMAGNQARLYDNSVVEIASLRFTFSVNHNLFRVISTESVPFNLLL